MPFATVAVPFDAYAALPTPQHRWLLMCLARYADRDGRCWPSMRQLAADARMSKSSVQRYLADLSQLGIFSRVRRPGGRYSYVLTETFRPQWKTPTVPKPGRGVPQHGTEEARVIKHYDLAPWENRLRSWRQSRFWLPFWGPKPDEPGCWAPEISRETSAIPINAINGLDAKNGLVILQPKGPPAAPT